MAPPRRSARSRIGTTRATVCAALALALLATVTVATSANALPATGGTAASDTASPCSQQKITDADGNPVTRPYNAQTSPLLLPPWSDGGGWQNPSSFETIVSGDIDDDGWGDLIGRNGTMLDAYTPAPPSRAYDQPPYADVTGNGVGPLRPPFPLHWVPKESVTPAPAGKSSTDVFFSGSISTFTEGSTDAVVISDPTNPARVPGFADPSRYSTFRIADLDGPTVPGRQLIVRTPVFGPPPTSGSHPYGNNNWPYVNTYQGTYLMVYGYRAGQWQQLNSGPSGTAWNDTPSATFGPQKAPPSGETAKGDRFFMPQYYQSLTVGDVDGDGRDELVSRDANGIFTAKWTAADGWIVGSFDQPGTLTDGYNEFGSSPKYWSTIRVADVIPDPQHKAELVARSNAGTEVYSLEPGALPYQAVWTKRATLTTGAFKAGADAASSYTDKWMDDNPGFNLTVPSESASTIRTANIDAIDGDEVLSMDTAGKIWAYRFEADGTTTEILAGVPLLAASPSYASPASGAQYWTTLQGADVVGGAAEELLIRASDGLHVVQYVFSPTGGSGTLTDAVPVLNQMSDANGWDDPSKYATIQVVDWATRANPAAGDSTEAPNRALVGRDVTGVRTYWINPLGSPAWSEPSADFPSWAGGLDPNSHGDDSQWGTAYGYVNDSVAKILNWAPSGFPGENGTPVYPTIRSKFATASGLIDWEDVASLVLSIPPSPDATNIPRADFETVKQQIADWTRDYGMLLQFFFSDTTGLQELLITGLIEGDQTLPISSIQAQFDPNDKSRMWALFGNLVAGLLASLAPELLIPYIGEQQAKDLMSDAGKAWFTMSMNMIGAAINGTIPYLASPDGKLGRLQVEAEQLDSTMAAVFCGAISFFYGSSAAAQGDLGQILAMGRTIRALPVSLQAFQAGITSAGRQRSIWAYQQFAAGSTKAWIQQWNGDYENISKTYKNGPSDLPPGGIAIGKAIYQPTNECSIYPKAPTPAPTVFDGLGVDPADLTEPTLAYWLRESKSYEDVQVGDPVVQYLDPQPLWASSKDKIVGVGLGGWHLPLWEGNNATACVQPYPR